MATAMGSSKPNAPISVLAIDLGASSGRAVVGTLVGDRVHTTEVHRFRTPLVDRHGHLFWDLDTLWKDVREGLLRAFAAVPAIASISVDSWGVDYVALDRADAVISWPYAYRDTRTVGRLAQLFERVPAADVFAMTGTQFLPFNTLSQIMADLTDHASAVSRTSTRLLIADYLLYRLSGVKIAEYTLASTTQLFDVSTNTWALPLVRALGDSPERYPRTVAPGTPLGRLRETVMPEQAGQRPVVIATCSHDTAAAVAAVPALGDELWAYISSGTWSLVGVELREPILNAAAQTAGFTNEIGIDHTIRFLKNRTGLWVLEECMREWTAAGERHTWESLHAEAERVESPGYTIDLNAPGFGERGAMLQKIQTAAALQGVDPPRTRAVLVRLVLVSLAASYSVVLDELAQLTGQRPQVVHVVGGGARNHLLNQLTADACGRRVVAGPDEATVLGNLLLQFRTLGALPVDVSIRQAARASADLFEFIPQRAPLQRTVALSAP